VRAGSCDLSAGRDVLAEVSRADTMSGDAVRPADATLADDVGTAMSGLLTLPLVCWQPATSTPTARKAVKAIRLRVLAT
jgi:hypothetical protein